MTRHVAYEAEASPGQWMELEYDTDDVADVSSRIMPGEDAILTITFKPGKRPMWEPKGRATPAEATADTSRALLGQAADALWNCAKAALTVKPTLSQPYPDAPESTPYTRWVERPARRAHDLAMEIRKHLRTSEDHQ